MACAACGTRLEAALKALLGVKDAAANVATGKVRVTLDGDFPPQALAEKVEGLGFSVRREQVRLRVEGMTCAGCAARIEQRLRELPGVLAAEVSFVTGNVTVRYLSGVLSPAEIRKAILDLGFAIRDMEAKEQEERRGWEDAFPYPLLAAGLLTLSLFYRMLAETFGLWFPPLFAKRCRCLRLGHRSAVRPRVDFLPPGSRRGPAPDGNDGHAGRPRDDRSLPVQHG